VTTNAPHPYTDPPFARRVGSGEGRGITTAVVVAALGAICVAGVLFAFWLASRRPVYASVTSALEKVEESIADLTDRIDVATSAGSREHAHGLDAIGSTIEIGEVLQRALAAATAVPAFDGGSINVQRANGRVHSAVQGLDPESPALFLAGPPGGAPFDSGIVSWDVADPDQMRSGVVVPIAHDRPGTLAVFSRTAGAFDADAIALLTAIARSTAPAIENAFRYLDVQEQVATDTLTGLGSPLAFAEALSREVMTARRSGRPLCLLMVDLDDFGAYNKPPHSHEVGDTVLAEFGARVRATIRGSDTAYRNSGGADEFFLILPDTTRENAIAVHGRLALEVAYPPVAGVEPPLTMSSGLAEFLPTDTAATLQRRAGAAQSVAKSHGKNQLVADDDPRVQAE
jgi:diguanylate cyclase (GGDEF)-like protein